MEVLQSRADSFKAKRVQNPAKPSSSVNLKWPHPRRFNASPAVLAEAGFYFNPSYEDRDSVSCFYCDKQLSQWEANDDPFDIHWEKCRTTCCWAIVRCGLRGDMDRHRRFISADKSRLPTSKNMEQARLGTFQVGKGWVHDRVEDHGANSRKMARAGFVYTPQHEGDDLATCLYCEVSLGGWDAEDDPMEEHNKRGNKSGQQCAFLAALDAATTTKPASRSLSQSKPPSKPTQSKSKHKDIVLPTKTHDGELEDDSEGGVPPAASSAKRSTRGRSTSSSTRSASGSSRSTKAATTVGKTPKKHTRSQSRGGLKDVNEDVENAEEEGEPELMPAKTRRPTTANAKTSRSRSVSRRVPGAFTDDEEEVTEVVEKKTAKGKSKANAEAYIEGDGEVEEVKVLKKSTRGRPKTKTEDDEVEGGTNLKKSTRDRPKGRVASAEEEPVEEDEGEKAPRKPSRKKSKAKFEPEQEPEGDAQDVVKPPSKARPKPTAPVTRKPSRTKPKPPVVEELEDVEETLPTPTIPVTSKKTRTASSANTKARSTSKPKSNTHLIEDEDIVFDDAVEEADEMDVFVHQHPSPPPQPPSPLPILSDGQKEKEREGLSEPEELSPLVIPKRSPKGKGKVLLNEHQGREDSRVDVQSTVPKTKEKQKNIDKTLSMTTVGESSEEAPEPQRSKKPPPKATSSREIPAKVLAPSGDAERIKIKKAGNARKGIKIVEISTDEEDGDDDMKDKAQHKRSATNQRVETLKPKPEEKDPFVEMAPPASKPDALRPLSPIHITTKAPIKEPEDVEMSGADDDIRVEDQPQIHIEQDQEDPPKTPLRGQTNGSLSQSDPLPASAPTLVFPPLSKLPFTPIQNLSEAELDMTVEEWIRYQMEVEYDKFRRDGERELGRFKQRAEEVRGIIEGL